MIERQTKRILPEGLNLLTPTDAERGSLQLQNIRPDSAGEVRSRGGTETLYAGGGYVHTLFLSRDPEYRLAGVGTTIRKDAASLDTGYDGEPLFPINEDGFVWVMNRTKQTKNDGTTVTGWSPAAPTVAPTLADTAAGEITGSEIRYYYTWANADDHETNPSPGEVIAVTARQITVTVPAMPGGITQTHIYRIGGSIEFPPLRVGTITSGTTFVDNRPDWEMTDSPIELAFDQGPAPACRGAVMHQGRVFGWSTAADPNGLYWAKAGKPWAWASSAFAPIGAYGEETLRCTSRENVLHVYKTGSVWRVVGDADTAGASGLEPIAADIGLVGAKAVASASIGDFMLSRKGVYLVNSVGVRKVSDVLNPIFEGRPTIFGSGLLDGINQAAIEKSVLEVSEGVLYVSIPTGPATAPDVTLCMDIESGRWFDDTRGFSALHWEGSDRGFAGALAVDNSVVYLDSTPLDGTDPIDVRLKTRFMDFGLAENPKRVSEVTVEHNTRGETLAVRAEFDDGTIGEELGAIVSGTSTSSVWAKTTLRLAAAEGQDCRNVSIRIMGEVSREVAVRSIAVSFVALPRKSKRLVIRPVTAGSDEVLEIRRIEVDIDISGDTTVELLTDGPFGVMAVADTQTLTATGRRQIRKTFTANKLGRLVQVRVASAADFQLYDCSIEARQLPGYLAAGQAWTGDIIPLSA
jgi:hypothetical protein